MNILFLTRRAWPYVGGVEKHVYEISRCLTKSGHKIKVISERDILFPKIKYIGLLYIWYWFLKNRKLIKNADIIHCHDTFIWYLPFRFIYPKKKVITTIHGLEWSTPLRKISLFQKRLAMRLSHASVGIGGFLEKYLNLKFDLISYGASRFNKNKIKDLKKIVYVGRLEDNTGITKFLDWLQINQAFQVDFCGDGNLRNECEKKGVVHGFVNPTKFYKSSNMCVPGGYLAALEALNSGCHLKLFWNNDVKKDYWKMSPFYKLKGDNLISWAKKQTWEKFANEYLNLYKQVLK